MDRGWTRRELICDAVAACAASATAAPPAVATASTAPLTRPARPIRVAVLGAGLAGLVAAHELVKAGHEVTVLEARTRPGGRVLTLREPFADGLYAEAGALFIPDNHAHTLRYARDFSLPLASIPPRAFAEMYYIRDQRVIPREGRAEEWPLDLTPDERQMGHRGMWQKYIGRFLEQMVKEGDPAAAAWPPESLKPLDQMTMSDFLKRQGASADAIALLRLGALDLWGDGIDTTSALAILRDSALRLSEQRVYHIRGGNDQLPKAFAKELADNIRYGCAVTGIEHGPSSVAVTYVQASKPYRLTADRVVCTLPFSTLRKVEVTPAFSPAKTRAIAELPYTSVARVYLQTRTKFWAAAGLPAMTNTDLPLMWVWEPTFDQPGPRGIMESYSAGPAARKATALRESERLEFTIDQMEKVFPGMRRNCEGGASKCWDEDEWSRGDYAWFKPGQVTSLLPHIARSEGRVHYAGEHTSAWPGWMQGALDSGLRAAREVNGAA